jgi:hypothetical protein
MRKQRIIVKSKKLLKLIVISLLSELIEVESPGSYIGRKFPTTGRYLEIFILHIGIGVRFHVSGVMLEVRSQRPNILFTLTMQTLGCRANQIRKINKMKIIK